MRANRLAVHVHVLRNGLSLHRLYVSLVSPTSSSGGAGILASV